MIIVLIRHGMTEGNVSRRYIGITDENLCPKGQEILNENIKNRMYPMADIVFSRTMKDGKNHLSGKGYFKRRTSKRM